jgi:Ribonuclease G/E
MTKELFVCSSPHETKVALTEDDQLVEVYYQRDTDVGLVGGIYKGRVSRVLPGMQSAFVNIGLERDAFYTFPTSLRTPRRLIVLSPR